MTQSRQRTQNFNLDVRSAVFEWEKKKNRNALSPNAKGVRRGTVCAEHRRFYAARGSGGVL